MKKKPLFHSAILMQMSIFLVFAAIIFDDNSWLPKIAGIAIIISSILSIADCHIKNERPINYIVYILLITVSSYLIIS